MRKICIGTQSKNLQEALLLTPLPALLKEKDPGLKIYSYFRGFNPVVFQANPWIDGIAYLPKEILGTNFLQSEEKKVKNQMKPEIYLTHSERQKCKKFIQNHSFLENTQKPLCLVHARGQGEEKTAPIEFWDAIIAQWGNEIRFWQIGLENDSAIQGCEYYYFSSHRKSNVRKLFALMSLSNAFLGVQSSPVDIARAFHIPTFLIQKNLSPLSDSSHKLDDFLKEIAANSIGG